MKKLSACLSHGCIILSLMLITLLIVDRFNPSMDFINNGGSKLFILLLCVLSSVLALSVLIRHRSSNR